MVERHFHVVRHGEDDDPLVTASVVYALRYAGDELDRITESEHELISICGEAGEFEEAYRAWERVQDWNNTVLNTRNIVAQHEALCEADRAPLYRGPGWRDRLRVATEHAVATLNDESPDGFRLWACSDSECRPDAEEE